MDNQRLINFLNQLLSNYFVMNVKLHRYHWFIQGRHFFTLHQLFKELYEMFTNDLDDIAERILMIDGKPLATMSKYLKEATIEEATADDKENEIIGRLLQDLQQLIKEMKEIGMGLADERKDYPTADLLTNLISKLEKYVWMLSSHQAYKE